MRTPRFLLPALVCFSATAAPAGAQTADAKDLLVESFAAHRKVSSFSAKVRTRFKGASSETTGELLFLRSGKAKVTAKRGGVTRTAYVQGSSVVLVSSQNAKTYQRRANVGDGKMRVMLTTAVEQSGLSPASPLASALTDSGFARFLNQPGLLFTRQRDEVVDGVLVNVVRVSQKNKVGQTPPFGATFAIGKGDRLLRRITQANRADGPPQMTVEYTQVRANKPFAASLLTFTPPPGMTAVTPPADYSRKLKRGATPLPLSGKDLEGRAVSLAQYKGKVVLIDFWATWCGPCVAEMPNVAEAYKKYRAKGFDVVGVSLDDKAGRGALVAFVRNNKVPWRQIYDGRGWQEANAVRYGVRAIPFTVLVGRDGKIAAVNARGAGLAPAIEAALKR